MKEEPIDPVFMDLDASLEFLLSQCRQLLSAAAQAPGPSLADALNYRDDLETALLGNPELAGATLARVEEIDQLIGRNLAAIRARVDQDFARQMQITYPPRHWWWWAATSVARPENEEGGNETT